MRRSVFFAFVTGLLLCCVPSARAALVLTSSRTIDAGGDDFVRAVDADSQGNIYATGEIMHGNGDVWLAKYNASLVMTASATFDGPSHVGDYGYDIKVGADGFVYVGGEINNAGNIWLAKYDTGLRLVSYASHANGTINTCNGIALDRHGNIYATGKTGSGSSCDIWVARFDSSLALISSVTISNPVLNRSVDEGFGITVDDSDNVYVTGSIGGPSPDIWLGKFTPSLTLSSSTRINCEGNDTDRGYRVAYFNGQVYAAGCFYVGNYPHFWTGRFRASDLVLQSSMTILHPDKSEIAGGIDIDGNGTVFVTGRVYDDANRIWFGRYDSSLVIQSSAAFGSGSGLALTVKTSEHRNTAWLGGNVTNNGQQDLWMGKYVENLAPPSAPAGFTATALSTDTVLFSWDDTADAENGFRFYDAAGNVIRELPEDTTSWMELNMLPDTASPVWEIRAFNELGESSGVSLSSACYTFPASPAHCAVAARTTGSLTIQWDGYGASSFRVEISSDDLHWDVAGDNVAGTAYMIEGLRRSSKYYVRVWGCNHNNLASAGNARIVTMTEPVTPPEQPSGFTGLPLSIASIGFHWQDNSDIEEGFRIYTATGGLMSELSADTTEWIQTNLAPNEASAAWAVRSFNFGGESGGVALSSPCYSLVNAPTGFSALERSTDSVTLQWDAGGASSFQVRWSSDSIHWSTADNVAGTSYLCGGLQRASTYYFRIQSYNGGHIISSNSSFLLAKTEPVSTPPAPAGFTATALATSMARYSWAAGGPSVEGYRLRTSTGALIAELSPAVTAWLQAGMAPNTPARAWSLCAFNTNGEGEKAELTAPCYTFALTPADPEITASGQASLGIRWNGDGGSSFRVDCSSSQENWTTVQESLLSASYTQNALRPGTTYYFRIWALNGNGIRTEAYAAVSGVTSVAGAVAPPSDFFAEALSSGSIRYCWKDMSADEDGFTIYSTTGGILAGLSPGATQWVHSGLQPDTAAAASDIRSFNSSGESAPVFLSSVCYTLAGMPYGLAVSSLSAHRAVLQWSCEGASSYRIMLSSDLARWSVPAAAPARNAALDGLFAATTYYARVSAVNHDGAETIPVSVSFVTDALNAAILDPSQSSGTVTCAVFVNGEQKQISVSIPQGASAGKMYVVINPDAGIDPLETSGSLIQAASARFALGGGTLVPGSITEFVAYDAQGRRITGPFSLPVTITIPYPDSDSDGFVDGVLPSLNAGDLQMYTLDEQTGEWECVGGTVDRPGNVVSAAVTHFSVYALAARRYAVVPAATGPYAYPNPFRPSRDPALTIAAVSAGTRAYLYTIAGELVRELTDEAVPGRIFWDGRNDSGAPAASGVYIALLKGNGTKRTIKIVVLR